jgi:hypothetical protein
MLRIEFGHEMPDFDSAPLAGTASATEKPNAVFILADDLGWGELGC